MFPGGVVPERFERQVSASLEAFARDLRMAWPAGVASPVAGRFCLREGDTALEIDALPAGVRRLGLFELPQLTLHYRFSGGTAEARAALLTRLDRAMQRGGG